MAKRAVSSILLMILMILPGYAMRKRSKSVGDLPNPFNYGGEIFSDNPSSSGFMGNESVDDEKFFPDGEPSSGSKPDVMYDVDDAIFVPGETDNLLDITNGVGSGNTEDSKIHYTADEGDESLVPALLTSPPGSVGSGESDVESSEGVQSHVAYSHGVLPIDLGDSDGESDEHKPCEKDLASAKDYLYALQLEKEMLRASQTLWSCAGIVEVTGDTAIIGDLHGDLHTFMAIKSKLEPLLRDPRSKVVFLGDIMDRGDHSALTLLELLKFFNKYPNQVFIVRGNHETKAMYETPVVADKLARDEPILQYVDRRLLYRFFDQLPYAAVINGTTLAVHGGVPPQEGWLSFFSGIKYSEDAFTPSGSIYHALWSDYVSDNDNGCSFLELIGVRGGGTYGFNEKAAEEFLECGKLIGGFPKIKYIIRGHQKMVKDGQICTFHQSPKKIITTVFSAIENQYEFIDPANATVAVLYGDSPNEPPQKYCEIS